MEKKRNWNYFEGISAQFNLKFLFHDVRGVEKVMLL